MTSYPCSSKRWRGWPCTASVSVPAAVVASRWHKWTVWCCQFLWAGTQWLSKVSFSSPGSRGHVALRAARKTQILTSPRAFLKNAWLISYNYTAALKEALKLFQLWGFQHVWTPWQFVKQEEWVSYSFSASYTQDHLSQWVFCSPASPFSLLACPSLEFTSAERFISFGTPPCLAPRWSLCL